MQLAWCWASSLPYSLGHSLADPPTTLFSPYPSDHFSQQHFPCQHPSCLEKKFVVFASVQVSSGPCTEGGLSKPALIASMSLMVREKDVQPCSRVPWTLPCNATCSFKSPLSSVQELRQHTVKEHGEMLGKAERRAAMVVPVSFSVRRCSWAAVCWATCAGIAGERYGWMAPPRLAGSVFQAPWLESCCHQ